MSDKIQDIVLLFSSIRDGDIDQVSELIELGYDVNSIFEEGCTPAIQAAAYGKIEILKVLVEAGADVNIMDQQMCTPLMAAILKEHQEIIEYLSPLTSEEIKEIIKEQLDE